MPDRQPKTDSQPMPIAAPLETIPFGVDPMVQLLKQLRDLAAGLDAERYNLKPESTKCGAIGGHIRHTLDHVGAWLCGVNQETINYDDRERGTDIETNPQTAVKVIDRYMDRLAKIEPASLLEGVAVFTSMTSDGALMRLPSTHARELAFVFSHTVHHNAIIGTIARAQGVELPDNFGTAPSTIAYRHGERDGGCAQ